MELNEFIPHLRQNENSEKKEGMENYMRNKFSFLGLQATKRRKLSSAFQKELRTNTLARYSKDTSEQSIVNWEALYTLWALPEREFQLAGIDYLKRIDSYLVLDDLPHLKFLILKKSWWDTVDFLAKSIGTLVVKHDELINVMKKWSVDENIWIRRVSVLHQLRLKNQTNTQLLKEVILNNSDDNEFFIQKAIGWSLREYAKTDEQWVKNFVEQYKDRLSPLSVREAIKNIQ